MKLHRLLVPATALALLAGAAPARAAGGDNTVAAEDTASPGSPIHDSERHSWTASVYGGMGDLHTFPEKQDEIITRGNGVAFDVGRALSQHLLVLGMAQLVNGGDMNQTLYGAGVQYFFNQRIYGRVGLGIANYKFQQGGGATGVPGVKIDRWAPGATAALGVEWLQLRTLAFDGQLSWLGASYPNDKQGDIQALNVALCVGVRWYGP